MMLSGLLSICKEPVVPINLIILFGQ